MAETGYRIVFMGTPDFAVPALRKLAESRHRVVLVVSQPDRPRGRGRKLTPTPVKSAAADLGLALVQPEKIKTGEFADRLRETAPDLAVVAAFGRILPKEIIDIPRLGTINIHGSLLPAYRGAAPIQRAIINGETTTGITIMQMDEGMDTGDILLQREVEIGPDDTSGTLFPRMAETGAELLLAALDLLAAGRLTPVPQDDSRATTAPPIRKEEGIPDWNRPARELACLIRGLDPWPLVKARLDDEDIRLFSPRPVDGDPGAEPGTVVRADGEGVLIACGQGLLLVRELQRPGGKRLAAADFLRGRPIEPGQRFRGLGLPRS